MELCYAVGGPANVILGTKNGLKVFFNYYSFLKPALGQTTPCGLLCDHTHSSTNGKEHLCLLQGKLFAV